MSWEAYFEKNKGRPVRTLYAKAIEHAPAPISGERIAIDLGSGAGIEAADLLQRGWRVLALDRESSALSVLENLVSEDQRGRLEFICSSFEELHSLPADDFVHSYHSLSFCKTDRFDNLIRLVLNSVKSGGLFAGSFFGNEDEWAQKGSAAGIGEDKLRQHLRSFELLHFEEFKRVSNTTFGESKHWHFYDLIARKI